MSHIVTVKIEMKDVAAIKAACTRLGWEFLEGQKTYKWFGRSVGDYPLPEGFTESDLGKCSHAIKVPGASYEIGLVAHKGGFMPLWDFWQTGGLKKENGSQLAQAYGVCKATREAQRRGYRVTESRQKDGSIKLCIPVR